MAHLKKQFSVKTYQAQMDAKTSWTDFKMPKLSYSSFSDSCSGPI